VKFRMVVCLACVLFAVLQSSVVNADSRDPYTQARRLNKSICLATLLDGHPNWGDDWAMPYQPEQYVRAIKHAGFRAIRLHLNWDANADEQGNIDPAYFEKVDRVIHAALHHRMMIVLNMHYFKDLTAGNGDQEANIDRFLYMWEQIAWRYRWKSKNILFEPFNEPRGEIGSVENWNALVAQVVATIREQDNGRHTLVIDTARYANPDTLDQLVIPEEESNAIVSVHFYWPGPFTFQAMPSLPDAWQTTPIYWPGPPGEPIEPVEAAQNNQWLMDWYQAYNEEPYAMNPAGGPAIDQRLDAIAAETRPIWVGEFGVFETADIDSRIRWLTYVREGMEVRGISWSVCNFSKNGFSLYNIDQGEWHQEIIDAVMGE